MIFRELKLGRGECVRRRVDMEEKLEMETERSAF